MIKKTTFTHVATHTGDVLFVQVTRYRFLKFLNTIQLRGIWFVEFTAGFTGSEKENFEGTKQCSRYYE